MSALGALKAYGANPSPVAHTVGSIPSINPANVTWNLESQMENNPTLQSSFALPKNDSPVRAAGAPSLETLFKFRSAQFVGSDRPVPDNVQAVYKAYLNKPVNLDVLLQLADQMQAAYRNDGYILIRIIVPPQQINPKLGMVKFRIIEGQIQNVVFQGDNPRNAKKQLQRYADAIENENPITYQTIDHFLSLANSLPGINVTATLVPNPKIVGAADLVINVHELGQSGFLSFNNYGTPYIGPGQALAGGSIYDIFGADSLSVSGATSTSRANELSYVSASYDLITGPYSTEINPMFSTTETRPGGALQPLGLVGSSSKYTFNVNQPLVTRSTQNLTLNTGIYRLNSMNSAFGGEAQLYDDQISAITAGLTYKGILWQSQNNFDAYTTIGLPILGVPNQLSQPSRVNGKTQFIMLDFDTSTTHYMTQNVSFNVSTTGQITPQPLLVSEQLGYGGMSFGQGFTPYIISGDNGVFGNFALRYDLPTFGGVNLLQPQVFYSAGMVANNQALIGTLSGASASSAGFGITMVLFRTCQVGMMFAKPLTLTQIPNAANGWQALINVSAVF